MWWSQEIYPTEVEPNLRGSVYLEHLTPMTLNEKALSWLHSAEQQKLGEEARAERSTAAARNAADATANNRTLQGFDMQTELSVNLLENQIKVNKIFLDK